MQDTSRSGQHVNDYRPDIDGLRAVAVLSVVLYHIGGFGLTGGFGGVDVFFVISGYLIASIVKRELEAGTFSFFDFYERRVRRIFPALFAVMVVTSLAAWMTLLPDDFREFSRSLLGVATISSNFYFRGKTVYFDTAADEKPLLHTWSLSVEEQFYVFFPLVLWLLYKLSKNAAIVGLGIITALSIYSSMVAVNDNASRAFFSSFPRIWEILVGVLTAFVPEAAVVSLVVRNVLAAVGLGSISFGIFTYSGDTLFPGPSALIFCLGAALVIQSGRGSPQTVVAKLLSITPMRWVGLISYSLYLWHWPILAFARYRFPQLFTAEGTATWLLALSILGLSFASAYLSWRFIERPFRTRNGVREQRQAFAWYAGLTAVAVALSSHVMTKRGYPERWPAEISRILDNKHLYRSASCEALKADSGWPTDACRAGVSTVPVDTVVWGDSHAYNQVIPVDAEAKRKNRNVVVMSMGGCPPLLGVMIYWRSKSVACRDMNDTVVKLVASHKIKTVILFGRWAYYADGKRYIGESSAPAPLSPDGIGRNPEIFSDALESTARRLHELGAHVVVVGPIPEQRFRVAPMVARNFAWQQELPLDLPRRAFEERQRNVMPALERVAKLPGVTVLYPERVFCNQDVCRAAVDGAALYTDNNHLSLKGLEIIAPVISEAIAHGQLSEAN